MQCLPHAIYGEMVEASGFDVRQRDLDAPGSRLSWAIPAGVALGSFFEAEQRCVEFVLPKGNAWFKTHAAQMELDRKSVV